MEIASKEKFDHWDNKHGSLSKFSQFFEEKVQAPILSKWNILKWLFIRGDKSCSYRKIQDIWFENMIDYLF